MVSSSKSSEIDVGGLLTVPYDFGEDRDNIAPTDVISNPSSSEICCSDFGDCLWERKSGGGEELKTGKSSGSENSKDLLVFGEGVKQIGLEVGILSRGIWKEGDFEEDSPGEEAVFVEEKRASELWSDRWGETEAHLLGSESF